MSADQLPEWERKFLEERALRPYPRGEQCSWCGTNDNIVWFTDNVLWNEIIRQGDYVEPALCIPCFVGAVAKRGFSPTGWRLIPEFHWETTAEYNARRGGTP